MYWLQKRHFGLHIAQLLGKFAACALDELVKALKSVDLPTFGNPTIPHLKLICY